MAGKVCQCDIQQFLAVIVAMLIPSRFERRTRLQQNWYHLLSGNRRLTHPLNLTRPPNRAAMMLLSECAVIRQFAFCARQEKGGIIAGQIPKRPKTQKPK